MHTQHTHMHSDNTTHTHAHTNTQMHIHAHTPHTCTHMHTHIHSQHTCAHTIHTHAHTQHTTQQHTNAHTQHTANLQCSNQSDRLHLPSWYCHRMCSELFVSWTAMSSVKTTSWCKPVVCSMFVCWLQDAKCFNQRIFILLWQQIVRRRNVIRKPFSFLANECASTCVCVCMQRMNYKGFPHHGEQHVPLVLTSTQ